MTKIVTVATVIILAFAAFFAWQHGWLDSSIKKMLALLSFGGISLFSFSVSFDKFRKWLKRQWIKFRHWQNYQVYAWLRRNSAQLSKKLKESEIETRKYDPPKEMPFISFPGRHDEFPVELGIIMNIVNEAMDRIKSGNIEGPYISHLYFDKTRMTWRDGSNGACTQWHVQEIPDPDSRIGAYRCIEVDWFLDDGKEIPLRVVLASSEKEREIVEDKNTHYLYFHKDEVRVESDNERKRFSNSSPYEVRINTKAYSREVRELIRVLKRRTPTDRNVPKYREGEFAKEDLISILEITSNQS